MYTIRGFLKSAEEDRYEDGCDPDNGFCMDVGISFSADTVDNLLEQVAEFLGIGPDDYKDSVELNACDEIGRVDFALMETDEGITADDADIEAWKRGDMRLWYVTYSATVESVEPVNLEE